MLDPSKKLVYAVESVVDIAYNGGAEPVRSREIAAPELRPAGLAGFLISEITIVATASYQGRWQAMIMGRDRRTYFVRVGDVLYDGRIVEIAGEQVIFEQDVEDLLGARSKLRVSKRLVIGNQEY